MHVRKSEDKWPGAVVSIFSRSPTQSRQNHVLYYRPHFPASNRDDRPQHAHLPRDHLPRRSTDRVPLLDTLLKVEDVGKDVVIKLRVELLILGKRQVGKRAGRLLSERDGPTGDVVRLPEGDALADN